MREETSQEVIIVEMLFARILAEQKLLLAVLDYFTLYPVNRNRAKGQSSEALERLGLILWLNVRCLLCLGMWIVASDRLGRGFTTSSPS